jgi:5'-AMP-activated protein kinase regulatory gamma subunit
MSISQEEERNGGKKGRLLGIITLSDVLRYAIGEPGIGEGVEKEEDPTPVAEKLAPLPTQPPS